MFGILFLRLHTLPERMAHRTHKLQFEIVAVLCLLALFTHIHLFWVAALLLAMIDVPDIGGALGRIAGSVEKMAGVKPGEAAAEVPSDSTVIMQAGRAHGRDAQKSRDRSGRAQGAEPCLSFFSAPC